MIHTQSIQIDALMTDILVGIGAAISGNNAFENFQVQRPAVVPPSIARDVPVMKPAWSEARYITAWAISSVDAIRLSGA